MSLAQARRMRCDVLVEFSAKKRMVRRQDRPGRRQSQQRCDLTAVGECGDATVVLVEHAKSNTPSPLTSRSTSSQVPTGDALRSHVLNANSQMKFALPAVPQSPPGTSERVHADGTQIADSAASRRDRPPGDPARAEQRVLQSAHHRMP